MSISRNSLAKNAIFIMLSDGFNIVGSFLFIILAARILGIEIFGKLSYAIALSSMLAIIADFGLSRFITMITARGDNLSEVFWGGILSRLIMIIIYISIAMITLFLIGVSREIYLTCTILVFSEALRAFSEHYRSFLRGLERMDWDFRANAWEGSIQSFLGVTLILFGYNIVIISFSYLVSRAFRLFLNIILLRSNVTLDYNGSLIFMF